MLTNDNLLEKIGVQSLDLILENMKKNISWKETFILTKENEESRIVVCHPYKEDDSFVDFISWEQGKIVDTLRLDIDSLKEKKEEVAIKQDRLRSKLKRYPLNDESGFIMTMTAKKQKSLNNSFTIRFPKALQ